MQIEEHRAASFRRILILTALGVFVIWVLPATEVAAVTYEVDRFDDNLAANGCTGTANDCSLRGAISKANSDGQATTIVLPDGTYQLTIAGADEEYNQTGDLDIREALEITAAPGANPVIEQTEADRVFHAMNGAGDLTIRGPMTITGGNSGSESGGLIYAVRNGSLILEDVALTDGQSTNLGGCLCFAQPTIPGSLSLTDVTISGCRTEHYGGGLAAEVGDSSATFDRVVIEDNTAGPMGGGVYISLSTTTVLFVDSTIQNNVSEDPVDGYGYGGGINFGSAKARFERSTVARNRAGVATGDGGWGGGINFSNSNVTLRNSTISGNVVKGSACRGSAIRLGTGSTLLLEQSTIVGDPASSLLWSAVGVIADGAVTFEGSIVEGGCSIGSGTSTSNGYNVERPIDGSVTTQCGLTNPSDVLTSSPFLKPLAGYGGPTETHALMSGAPAEFAVASGSCRTTDQRLAPRVDLFCDAGSYEAGSQAPGIWIFSDGFESGNTGAW